MSEFDIANTAQELVDKNNLAFDNYQSDRRGFLRTGLFATAVMGFWLPSLAEAATPATARRLKLANAHTGEKFVGEYWYNGKYLPDAFGEIKMLMRDHRTDERFPIDPRLMDILYVLQNRMENFNPFNVVSGYRSPKSNALLRKTTEGVARNSLHMSGQAIDMRLPGSRLATLKKTAIELRSGGVGYYPSSDFVHCDTGRVRTW